MFLDIIHHPTKTPFCLYYKIQRFGYWILSPSSGKNLLSWAQSIELRTGDRTSSIDWAHMNKFFFLKTETESSLRNIVFYNKNRTVFLDKTG
jgi:hypothetical protein